MINLLKKVTLLLMTSLLLSCVTLVDCKVKIKPTVATCDDKPCNSEEGIYSYEKLRLDAVYVVGKCKF